MSANRIYGPCGISIESGDGEMQKCGKPGVGQVVSNIGGAMKNFTVLPVQEIAIDVCQEHLDLVREKKPRGMEIVP